MLTMDSFAWFAKASFVGAYRFTARWLAPAVVSFLAGGGAMLGLAAFEAVDVGDVNLEIRVADMLRGMQFMFVFGGTCGFGLFVFFGMFGRR